MLAGAGNDEAAKQAYLDVLTLAPEHVPALVELGALAEITGHLSAARSAFGRAVQIDPQHVTAHTGLANTLRIGGDLPAAERHYRAALAAAPSFAPAHQGLAHTLFALGAPGAETHWRAGFGGQAVIRQRFRGRVPGIPLLLLIGGRGGDLHTNELIDDRRFAVAAICAELFDPAHALPEYAIVVNAIGDADLCAGALAKAERLVENTAAPIINHPSSVRMTGRESNAQRLSAVPWVVAPRIETVRRGDAAVAREFGFPLLLRSPGYHTGQHFVRVDTSENTDTRPSMAWRFQFPIIVWCTPCLVASCDAVSSPRNASIATLALNSAKYRFRLPIIRSVLHRRTKLNNLSDKPGSHQSILADRYHEPTRKAGR